VGAVQGFNIQVPAFVAQGLIAGGHAAAEPTFTGGFFNDPTIADPRVVVGSPTDVLITLIIGGMHVRSLADELVNWIRLPGLVGTSVQLRAFDAKGRHSDFELDSTTQVEVLGRFLRSYI
jgi:hypothetical protein